MGLDQNLFDNCFFTDRADPSFGLEDLPFFNVKPVHFYW